MMLTIVAPSLQGIINGLADQIGLPVVLEDANQQLLVYSPHYDVTDRIREETILRRSTAQRVVDWFGPFDIAAHRDPIVVPGDPRQGILARLCVPIRYLDAVLGYVWVLLPDGTVDDAGIAAALEARDHLSGAMLAESRTRARESDSLLSLVAADPDTRIQGLIDIEARGVFQPPRLLLVVVCSGPDWEDAGVRGAFWNAGWATEPQHQMRGVTPRDGIAMISVRAGTEAEAAPVISRALAHVGRARSGRAARLVIGVGATVIGPDRVHEAYRQARQAARVALHDTGTGPVAWWDRLGIYRILSQLPTRTLAEAIDPRIARLVAQQPELARTLEHYLEHAGAITAVAEALHIHRTTLYYRLERIRDVGLEPTSGVDRMASHTSLSALRLLGEWPITAT
ncbi:MAG TPA: helix-turn-helix domain-containing protein [Euzebya sp.]|nr:helix-turn-helix domain-containing protein [Euzebya sp.]